MIWAMAGPEPHIIGQPFSDKLMADQCLGDRHSPIFNGKAKGLEPIAVTLVG